MTCKNPESHEAHMELNGNCPWCGATDESAILSPYLSDEEAVAEIVRRHG